MSIDFSSVHNAHEQAVFAKTIEAASRDPFFAQRTELLIDAACVALNALQPHYIRHAVDRSFYLSDSQLLAAASAIETAVESALRYVQSRESQTSP